MKMFKWSDAYLTRIRVVDEDHKNLYEMFKLLHNAYATQKEPEKVKNIVHRLQVYVQDVEGQGLPNVEVQVSWESGWNRFFTGLKPEIDSGYADFQMSPGQVYDVVVWGTQVGDISTEGCPSEPAGWRLIFRRRE